MINNWEVKMPFFSNEIKKGFIHKYDGTGASREITDEQESVIEKVEAQHPHVRVVAVIEASYRMTGGEILHMEDYVLLDRELTEFNTPMITSKGSVEFLCYTVNKSWNQSEMGYIRLEEKVGMVKRVA